MSTVNQRYVQFFNFFLIFLSLSDNEIVFENFIR